MLWATSAMRTVAIGAERLGGARLGARHQSLMRPQPGTPGIEACAANAGVHLPDAATESGRCAHSSRLLLLSGYVHNTLIFDIKRVFIL